MSRQVSSAVNDMGAVRSSFRAGPALWNLTLTDGLRHTECMKTFKALRKTHYFKVAFNFRFSIPLTLSYI